MLAEATGLDESILKTLRPEDGLSFEQADHMIENAVVIFGIPIGIACNLTINERDVLVPMATEEPSVVAAASNAACIARVRGRLLHLEYWADHATHEVGASHFYRFSAQGPI